MSLYSDPACLFIYLSIYLSVQIAAPPTFNTEDPYSISAHGPGLCDFQNQQVVGQQSSVPYYVVVRDCEYLFM